MAQFKNKNDAMNRRIPVWVCKKCETHHDKKKLKIKTGERPTICISCHLQRPFYYFASRAEAKRFAELRLQERSGLITKLQVQVSYPVVINSIPITKYIADFTYLRYGHRIIEDVKGDVKYLTDVFKLKKKLVEAIYTVEIKLVER